MKIVSGLGRLAAVVCPVSVHPVSPQVTRHSKGNTVMPYRTGLKALSACAAIVAPVALIILAPVSASAAPLRVAANPSSTNYAGWISQKVPDTAQAPSAQTTFIVPTVTCAAGETDFVVPGVGLPTGTTSIIASGVVIGCSNGAPFYQAESDIDAVITKLKVSVHPGDKVTTSLSVSSSATTGIFKDVTQHFATKLKGKGGEPSASCVGIDGDEESGSADPTIPAFGKVVFSASTIDGTTISGSGAFAVNMATSTGILQIKTEKLNSKGNGFTSTFENTGG